MNVTVVGALGNMGRRYTAILKYLNHGVLRIDLDTEKSLAFCLKESNHVVVSTPTQTHAVVLNSILETASQPLHVLCEKPICEAPEALEHLFSRFENEGHRLYCVNQYAYLPETQKAYSGIGPTRYNYYRHGYDGIHWDCFQIYALARGSVSVDDKSPIWDCEINGIPIDIRHMDRAYVDMISDFLDVKNRMWPKDLVIETTGRILQLQ